MEETEELALNNVISRSKGKSKTSFLKEIFVDVKPRIRRGKCVGAEPVDTSLISELEVKTTADYQVISDDVWYHISKHIVPEDVQTFALICRQTAALVNSIHFWRNLYKRYCQTKRWTFLTRSECDALNCGGNLLRLKVITALFQLYTPLKERVYSLDMLIGRRYISTYHEYKSFYWLTCIKLCKAYAFDAIMPQKVCDFENSAVSNEIVDNWEALADTRNVKDDKCVDITKFEHPQQGVCLLLICCNGFVPTPIELISKNAETRPRFRLVSTRAMLTRDMRGSNLELDYEDVYSKLIITVKYPQIIKYRVVPWWDVAFKQQIKLC